MSATATPPVKPRPRARRRRRPAPDVPKLAEGMELVGEFEDSGFKEPQYIARRADGQVIQLSELLHIVADEVDGERDFAAIAERTSGRFGRTVSAGNVQFLVDKQLRPLGVLAAADGSSPELRRADPLLALKFRTALLPEGFVRAITTVFRPLFWPPVLLAALGGLVALDVWLFFVHGIGQGTRQLAYQPLLLVFIFGLVVVATFLHECGHATACRYGGAKPGVMGAGIFIVWPAFYTDVTDAYRLDRTGRLRTDLGGIYFNGLFCLGVAGAFFLTGFEPLLIVILIQHLQMFQQLLPFLRLDGYYIISDLTGVPDMFKRIKPVLRSLRPGQEPDKSVDELKPWVRKVVTVYVIALIPASIAIFAMLALGAPRMFATAWDSFFVQIDRIGDALGDGRGIAVAAAGIQIAALTLPAAGFTFTSTRIVRRLGTIGWKRTEDRPRARAGIGVATVATIGLLAFVWWPNGEYRPIQPGEKGTLVSAARAVGHLPSGRPSLSSEREQELGGARSVREQGGDFRAVRGARDDETGPAPRGRESRTRGRARERRETGPPAQSAPGGGAPPDEQLPEETVPGDAPPQAEPQQQAPQQQAPQQQPREPAPSPEGAPEPAPGEQNAPSPTEPAPTNP